jgi:hypothetical protein
MKFDKKCKKSWNFENSQIKKLKTQQQFEILKILEKILNLLTEKLSVKV